MLNYKYDNDGIFFKFYFDYKYLVNILNWRD